MSVSKVHISKVSGKAAESILRVLESGALAEKLVDEFCCGLVNGLNAGLSNDYVTLRDNYSVGGDQMDYVRDVLARVSVSSGLICSPPWRIAYGFGFASAGSKLSQRTPMEKMHRLIFLNVFEGMNPRDEELLICMEEVLGPTVRDAELEEIQRRLISGLLKLVPGGDFPEQFEK